MRIQFQKAFHFCALFLALLLVLLSVTACGNKGEDSTVSGTIDVVSRESGSGTRGAFTELLGIVDKNEKDATTPGAEVTNSTSVMLQTVYGDRQSIGYVSLGSLISDVKALKIDGVEPTTENVHNGTYKISRPFNLVYKEDALSDIAKDFLSYLLSDDAQALIEKQGYIRVSEGSSYKASKLKGSLSLSGSTSVGPVMEALADAYKKLNPDATISIEQNGSTAGITAATNGVADFGMASRELSEDEAKSLTATAIARDGIAVIVNSNNPIDGLTSEQVRDIYLGTITSWDDLQ